MLSLLGIGGMGEVYRARDSRLKREVAIKVLPSLFAGDAARVARFQREAEMLAALNHPHIAGIHHLENLGESRLIVMELVEGETLADRIARGPIPWNETLGIAQQIASALEAAHEHGIVHRDLKPANVKVRPDGTVKVLDFGLAKTIEPRDAPHTIGITHSRMILGTPAYMSPEQATGMTVDTRADVWAFGCVLYEMLTGEPAFKAGNASETLARVLRGDVDWSLLPHGLSPVARVFLMRCLYKDTKQRVSNITDVRLALEGAFDIAPSRDLSQNAPQRKKRRAWVALTAAFAVIAALFSIRAFRSSPPPGEVRLEMATLPTPDPISLAVSPDGEKVVFAATSDGTRKLWLRQLNSDSSRPIAGSDFGVLPFWSPDGRSLGFFADGKLKRIDLDTGVVRSLANASDPGGGTWNKDGTILFAPIVVTPILRISDEGGEPAPATRLEGADQNGHADPEFLPDGRHFLYYTRGGADVGGVYIGQLDAPQTIT
jgi:eukaryotic-like serine/threonine-protein kinase